MPLGKLAMLSGTSTPVPNTSNNTTLQLTPSPRHTTTTLTAHQQCTTIPARRPFSTTPPLLKKGGKAARDESKSQAASSKDSHPADDPSDFSALEADIAAAVERLKDDLSKLRAGGRFNPELLENLRVQPDKNSQSKVRLSDVAQVVPKGRTVQVLVGEKDVSFGLYRNPGSLGGKKTVHRTKLTFPLLTARQASFLRHPRL